MGVAKQSCSIQNFFIKKIPHNDAIIMNKTPEVLPSNGNLFN